MKITRKDIANYKLLGVLLEKDKQKLADYIEKRPSCYAGKVYGSNSQFPYEPRGFSVSGCNEYEIAQIGSNITVEVGSSIVSSTIISHLPILNHWIIRFFTVLTPNRRIFNIGIFLYPLSSLMTSRTVIPTFFYLLHYSNHSLSK